MTNHLPPNLDAATLARLQGAGGAGLWRSLAELADDPRFEQWLRDEFPRHAAVLDEDSGLSRRQFLQLAAVSLVLGGLLPGCGEPPREQIVPFVREPEYVPGEAKYFATALTCSGSAIGVLVRSQDGRPVKIEGNPRHPASLGATDARVQAAHYSLYDPDRSQSVMHLGRISSWNEAEQMLEQQRALWDQSGGEGVHILSSTIYSPTLAAQIAELRSRFGRLQLHQYDPVNHDHALAAAQQWFGQMLLPRYHLDRAAVLVSLDSDLLHSEPGHVRYARDWRGRRSYTTEPAQRARLYVAEPMPTVSGAWADHRLAAPAKRMALLAAALAYRIGLGPDPHLQGSEVEQRWLDAAADDLKAHRGAGALVVGFGQPPALHVLAHRINQALGNLGQTITLAPPAMQEPTLQLLSLRRLVADLQARLVRTLIILDANPVYEAPADLDFAAQMWNVPLRVHLGLYHDETAELCHWHLPRAHELETWGDCIAFDGSATIQQPLIRPLYGSRAAVEVLTVLLQRPGRSAYELVREQWRQRGLDDTAWRQALLDGVIADSPAAPVEPPTPTLREQPALPSVYPDDGTLELHWAPDPILGDGKMANNGWLQECPKPITKLTWDNAAMLSPATAQRLGVNDGQMMILRFGGRDVRAPAWIVPGHADGSVSIHLGYGRSRGGALAQQAGFNAFALQRCASPWFEQGLSVEVTGQRVELACTQTHQLMQGRDLLRVVQGDAKQEQAGHDEPRHVPLSLYPEYRYEGPQWGMAIDLTSCMGCQACVVACQVENNVPIVGKEQVQRGREMHWLRIDRYFQGEPGDPRIHHQPVLCMHCEKAPCEAVCPVAATVHSHDGLNDMVYNRCIGTRYCSNNCPYKVRRFNFLRYAELSEPQALRHNPEVTVRTRGVMEKCTYCVQRIRGAEITSRITNEPIARDSFTTACAQACPTEAIVFGDINDPQSRVSQLKRLQGHYGLLAELGTQPRTGYLPRVLNPHRPQEPQP